MKIKKKERKLGKRTTRARSYASRKRPSARAQSEHERNRENSKFHPTASELFKGRVDVFISKSTRASGSAVTKNYEYLKKNDHLARGDR